MAGHAVEQEELQKFPVLLFPGLSSGGGYRGLVCYFVDWLAGWMDGYALPMISN